MLFSRAGLRLVLMDEMLELHPEGEAIRHIRCMESLGFLYGSGGEYVIGECIHCAAQPEHGARNYVTVVDLCAIAVDCTDIKPKIEFCFLLRESCRKLISEIPSVCSRQCCFSVKSAHRIAIAHADHIYTIEPHIIHRILSVKGCRKCCGTMTELKRMHKIYIEQPHPIECLWRIGISFLLLCAKPSETEPVCQTEIERIALQIEPLRKANLHRRLVHRLNGQLNAVQETV